MAFKSTDFKGHINLFVILESETENLKRINSIEELKKESATENGDFADFFISLNHGVKSSKRILYNKEQETFDVINEIDYSYQDDLTKEQLANETLIVEAIEKGALYKYDF